MKKLLAALIVVAMLACVAAPAMASGKNVSRDPSRDGSRDGSREDSIRRPSSGTDEITNTNTNTNYTKSGTGNKLGSPRREHIGGKNRGFINENPNENYRRGGRRNHGGGDGWRSNDNTESPQRDRHYGRPNGTRPRGGHGHSAPSAESVYQRTIDRILNQIDRILKAEANVSLDDTRLMNSEQIKELFDSLWSRLSDEDKEELGQFWGDYQGFRTALETYFTELQNHNAAERTRFLEEMARYLSDENQENIRYNKEQYDQDAANYPGQLAEWKKQYDYWQSTLNKDDPNKDPDNQVDWSYSHGSINGNQSYTFYDEDGSAIGKITMNQQGPEKKVIVEVLGNKDFYGEMVIQIQGEDLDEEFLVKFDSTNMVGGKIEYSATYFDSLGFNVSALNFVEKVVGINLKPDGYEGDPGEAPEEPQLRDFIEKPTKTPYGETPPKLKLPKLAFGDLEEDPFVPEEPPVNPPVGIIPENNGGGRNIGERSDNGMAPAMAPAPAPAPVVLPDVPVPLAEIVEMPVPLAEFPATIEEQEVPLGSMPPTGENDLIWVMAIGLLLSMAMTGGSAALLRRR